MASAERGYEDERFSHSVSAHFHCGICYNVFKEPVTCQRNEHCFCRACITEHLKNSPTCPTCQEKLSIETLVEAPRILRSCLDELNIRCDYAHRGCQDIVQLAQLQSHVQECGFAPVLCPNEGCLVDVNQQDLAAHQQAYCKFRKRTCCDCTELKQVVDEINVSINAVKDQVKDLKILKDMKESLVAVTEDVARTKDDTKLVLHRLEVLEEQVRATKEMQISMNEVQQSMQGNRLHPQNILVAGGRRSDFGEMKFVEMFNVSGMSWSPLREMNESRVGASAFVFNNEITVIGGNTNHGPTESLTKLPISPIMKNASWSQVSFLLPEKLYGHTSVPRCDGTILNIGGCNKNKNCSKDIICVSPRGCQLLYIMPKSRCFHGSEVFGNKIFIFGGRSSVERSSNLDSVMSYDMSENKCKQMASLPYSVSEMATVSWGDNVLLIGGADHQGKPLATVIIYNVKTERWHMFPPMNQARKSPAAVVIQNMIVVMGGRSQNNTCLCSVECFTFDNYSWQDFPAMITARERAVAVAF